MRLQHGALTFAPRLPESLGRLAFLFQGRRLRVEVTPTEATYRLLEGEPLSMHHHGEEILLSQDKAVSRPIPMLKAGPRPSQPIGRAPVVREAQPRAPRVLVHTHRTSSEMDEQRKAA